MKKLVTAFALCAAISAMAAVESQVVGYQTIDIPSGFSAATATFVTVGGDGTTSVLADIAANANFEGESIQLLSSDGSGNVLLIAYYYAGFGWYDGDNNDVNSTAITKGEAFIVSTGVTGAQLTFKGDVRATAFSIAIPSGFSLLGNSVPKSLTLGAVTANASFEGESIQLISSTDGLGSVELIAYYYAGFGWYDGDNNDVNTTPLAAATTFVVSTGVTGAELTFPAAL